MVVGSNDPARLPCLGVGSTLALFGAVWGLTSGVTGAATEGGGSWYVVWVGGMASESSKFWKRLRRSWKEAVPGRQEILGGGKGGVV